MKNSVIEPGVYARRARGGKLEAVQFDINRASAEKGNGINLMPSAPVPDTHGPTALMVSVPALRRILAELGEEL